MTELEVLLRDTFNRVAEPGDPAGVVDAIRARVDAGDTGTVPEGPQFPSGGGGFGGLLPAVALLPWIGGGLVLAIAGGTLGAIGVFGRPTAISVQAPFSSIERTTDGFDCPGGSPVTTFPANYRVLVIARSDDSAYLAVRDSYDYRRTVWVPASVVVVDGDQPAIDSLVVSGCYLPIVTANTPAPAPAPRADSRTPARRCANTGTGRHDRADHPQGGGIGRSESHLQRGNHRSSCFGGR